jgi:sulfide dehydrogenase cytochrome subunit
MRILTCQVIALVLGLGVFTTDVSAQEAASGAPPKMAKMCEGCHGPGGVSMKDTVPTIAGISEWVQEDNMHAYGDGSRKCAMPASDMMCTITAKFSHEQIEELGRYFSAMEFKPAAQEFDAGKAAAGAALHEEHCSKCHTQGGSNAGDDASILAGQWMLYLRTQLEQFANGNRVAPEGMGAKIEKLGEADCDALVHYYASQQ